MFKKVLIVDDHASINNDVFEMLSQEGITQIDKALYCDEAYLKVKKAIREEAPYDLIVTDLYFKKDHREREIASGKALVSKLRSEFADLSIIVYSQDDHFQTVRFLINECGANAFVCKSRESDKELPRALEKVFSGEEYLSKQIERALVERHDNEISEYDLHLMELISEGVSQSNISKQFRQSNIYPNSISSIEKRLNLLKDQFLAKNTTHLVSILKDHKLI
ncbi:response regulator [Pseudotenacibaculum haliotis]|uniref:Response regulator n=1 Tax=Pseudotenacibaculum haliotis TaxID=1862138 RepID=A0ABW5LWY2_9FLAO